MHAVLRLPVAPMTTLQHVVQTQKERRLVAKGLEAAEDLESVG
jgi:hypothetical protein